MSAQSRSNARLMLMCAIWFCQALATGCASSVTPPVSIPPPQWVPCSLEVPLADLTVRQAEERLLRAEEALGRCDAQGRAVIQAWPR